MTPRIEIIRRAMTDAGWGGEDDLAATFRLDGEYFESAKPKSSADVVAINTALDRLVDFVNAVAVVK